MPTLFAQEEGLRETQKYPTERERTESLMKKPSWIDDFKAFIMRGNVLDLAVGVVIGGAFTAIVTALVDCIINPLISLIIGGTDFSGVTLGVFPIGGLIMAVINFLCIAFVVFWMVRIINRASAKLKKAEEAPAEEVTPAGPTTEELLAEIRDLLKEKAE